MADLRDYKNKDFSVTINKRMNGIEIRYAAEMSDEQVAEIKEAGKWAIQLKSHKKPEIPLSKKGGVR